MEKEKKDEALMLETNAGTRTLPQWQGTGNGVSGPISTTLSSRQNNDRRRAAEGLVTTRSTNASIESMGMSAPREG